MIDATAAPRALIQDAADATKARPVPEADVRPCGLSDDLVRLMAAYWNSTDEGERVRAVDKYGAGRLFAGYPRRTAAASRPRTCRG